jgi:integrase
MRNSNLLTEKQVKHAKPGEGKRVERLLDGDRLYLQATVSQKAFDLYQAGGIKWKAIDDINRNYIFRYELHGVRHDLGLGPVHIVSLAEARRRAAELRLQLLDGIDPAQERAALKAEQLSKMAERVKATTFAQCCESYLKVHAPTFENAKHRQQWKNTLDTYAIPTLGKLNVADIETAHVVNALEPIWGTKAETASRVQGRIKRVFDHAIALKLRKDNPATRDLVKALLGKLQRTNGHHAALPVDDAPAFMAELRKRDSVSARALEFTMLTAARTGETIGATWDEIDTKQKLWTIPAERMKKLGCKREHRVPLTDRAIELLKALPHHGAHVFANGGKRPLSNMAMAELLKGMRPGVTVHGMRSTFKDWASERTSYPNEVSEMALSHTIKGKAEAAYRRGDLFEKRVRMMKGWADFLAKPRAAAATIDIDAERKRRRG